MVLFGCIGFGVGIVGCFVLVGNWLFIPFALIGYLPWRVWPG